MTDFYMKDGRYFGEDTSFYEFDRTCLERQKGWQQMDKSPRGTVPESPDQPSGPWQPEDFDPADAPEYKATSCDPDTPPNTADTFDRRFTSRRLDMLKTAIPFLPFRQQKAFACAVKLVEFRNLATYFGQDQRTLLGACSEEDPGMRMADMLEALRGYCSPGEQEQLDSLLQALMAVQMMRDGCL